MTAVLAFLQALQLESDKDILSCCTLNIHTTVVLSIPRQGLGPSLRALRKVQSVSRVL